MSENLSATGGRLEFQRQNLWVGLFVIVAAVVFVLVAAFAVQERVFRREYRLTTSFQGIGGLKTGGEVFLRGFVVGRVTRIALSTGNDVRFDVEFAVREEVRLPAGTRVRLSTRGFGSKVLDLVTPGDTTDPEAPPLPPPDRPVLYLADGASVPGTSGADLDALMADVLGLTRRITGTMQHLDAMMSREIGPQISATLASVNEKLGSLASELSATMHEARALMAQADGAIAESRPGVKRLLDSAGKGVDSADRLTQRTDEVVATVQSRLVPLLDDFASSLKQVDELTGRLQSSISEDDLKATIANLKSMSERGDMLVTELQKRPWRLMRRVKGEKEELMKELEAEKKAGQAPPSP
jgi:phospholipid/cholesterol/gamma-HCH transport system substrate-binding protein